MRNTYKLHLKYLTDQFKKLSKSESKSQSEAFKKAKEKLRAQISKDIKSLRDDNKAERDRVNSNFKELSKNLSANYKAVSKDINTEYENKYISELDKMRADSKFQKVSKRKKKSKK